MASEHLPVACLSLAWCILAAVAAFSSLIYCITMIVAQIAVIIHPNKQLVSIKERMGSIGVLAFYISLLVGHFYVGYNGFIFFYHGDYMNASTVSIYHFAPMILFFLMDYEEKEGNESEKCSKKLSPNVSTKEFKSL